MFLQEPDNDFSFQTGQLRPIRWRTALFSSFGHCPLSRSCRSMSLHVRGVPLWRPLLSEVTGEAANHRLADPSNAHASATRSSNGIVAFSFEPRQRTFSRAVLISCICRLGCSASGNKPCRYWAVSVGSTPTPSTRLRCTSSHEASLH